MTIVRRLAIVIVCGIAMMIGLEALLMRDAPDWQYRIEARGCDRDGRPANWTIVSKINGDLYRDATKTSLPELLSELRSWDGRLTLAGDNPAKTNPLAAGIVEGAATLDGTEATIEQLCSAIRGKLVIAPTRAVTIADVLAAKIPTPTLTRVSFPAFGYEDAFPDGPETDEPIIHIDSYHQAPMLADLDLMPAAWREHYPDSLPPVADRLPRNPAVVHGPDGVGRYGGVWRRATTMVNDLRTKIGYESFVRFDPSGKIQPCLAYKWEVANDNRVYTFYLRKGHRWSDGRPFTSEDILWACNDMNSPRFGRRFTWMQETNGAGRLFIDDITDWRGLATTLLAQAAEDAPSPGRQVARVGGEKLMALLRSVPADGAVAEDLQLDIVAGLNAAFGNRTFFDPDAFANADITSEPKALKAVGYSRLSAQQRERLILLTERADLFVKAADNINALEPLAYRRLTNLAFRAAYPKLIAKARIQCVKIEAVPDENGDAGHIVRFTFPRPNSIFLDKTATFMFYVSIFGKPKHFLAPLHPAGSDILNTVDILEWGELFASIRRQADDDAPSPRRQVWRLLDKDVVARITAAPPTAASDPAYKQDIVDALNTVLRGRELYDPQAWARYDMDAEWRTLTADGFASKTMNRTRRYRAAELLERQDLLRRVTELGIDDLNDDDRFRFNLWMFRAAFDQTAAPGLPLVAYNRENALNAAARNHPRRYDTWSRRLIRINDYHAETNRHYPTLRAWRPVTESTKQDHVAVRNPYYYRVDIAGNQLPYIDAVHTQKGSRKPNILLKMASGNIDFQVRDIAFEDYTYLKSHEAQGDYQLRLWANDYCGEVWFAPLQPHKDPEFRRLQDYPQFRHALSIAINRQEIIDTVYSGVGEPAQYSVPEGSPYYSAKQHRISIEYDPDRANRMLDKLGLDKRRADGIRLLWSGKPLIMNVDTREEQPLAVIRMACDYWRKIGIEARMKVRSYKVLDNMSKIGIVDIRVRNEGGNFFGPIMAGGYVPTHQVESVQWYNWAMNIRSGGRSGWEPPERIRQIQRMWRKVVTATSDQAKYDAWRILADRTADDLPIIGIMTSPGKLVYVRNNFKNVPKVAFAGWIAHDPGNCCPEAFFFDNSQ